MTRSLRLAAAVFLGAFPSLLPAQQGYRQPPAPIADILDAPQTPAVYVSPDHRWLLLAERASLPSIAELSEPELRLAGLRINPRTGGRSRDVSGTGLRLRAIVETKNAPRERRIETPPGARIGVPLWAEDSKRVAFTVTSDSMIRLWVADVATGAARPVDAPPLNATIGTPCRWIDNARLACKVIPPDRGAEPARSITPTGPVVQEAAGRAAPNRTYQDLLETPADERLFEHYATSRVAIVSADGPARLVGDTGIHLSVAPSPDGRYLLVTTAHRPFSYVVPLGRFPQRIEVWDLDGGPVKRVTDRPLIEEMSIAFDATVPGPRDATWREDAPATLVWTEALDNGDPARAAERRDRLVALAAPFTGEPRTLFEAGYRINDVVWAGDALALTFEGWWKSRRERVWAITPGPATARPRQLFDLSSEDRYGDPGRFVTVPGTLGTPVLLTTRDGKFAYLSGNGASPEGDRPFLDRIELATGKTTRLWRSQAPHYEFVVTVLDPDARRVITRREGVNEAPNYFLRDLRSGRSTALTEFKDPAPQFAGMTRELIKYKRADGVDLSATLYLPAGYDRARGPLPFLFWAYPQEFKTAAAAAQVRGSPYRFVRPQGASHLFLLTQGYGVLDDPAMPIVGEGSAEPNDRYIEQLVAGAQAAVDEVVRRGVADRERIAIGGHSYGAFMTANLLAHSDLFRTGIARSGAYNRTLTPFGFQAEERDFWKAQDTYMKMSPFTFAHRINEPVLMIHGEADNNSGTFPVQSERMFAAIKGNGGVVRYVLLPSEAHGYRARESVGHVLWEMVEWLDRYVKEGKKTAAAR
ncbi:MAG TPA: prolyl oligopeptidase family serine peptidase [Gemmatimonadaceae bacterium]|nr:prolyl oligopeptidase family serine peptidase [Gemmatimonadaceae bacterium]